MDIADLEEFQSVTYTYEKECIQENPKHRVLDRIGNIYDRLREARDMMPGGRITPYETARLLSESIGSLKAIHEHLFTEFAQTIDGEEMPNEEI
ncbi:MAG: hypothetical protein AAGB32_03770 [Pseudomonadota bacterium]